MTALSCSLAYRADGAEAHFPPGTLIPTLCIIEGLPAAMYTISLPYHRLTRANTPASVSFRRFLSFSPWRAPARLRLKNQKSLENTSLAGAEQKCVQTRKGPQRILAVLSRGLTQYGRISARQNHICPCQAMVPLFLCSYYGRRSGGIQMCEQHPKGPAAKWAQQERWGERPNRAFCPSAYLYKRVLCYISS